MFLFLGERPSLKAKQMNVSWKDGRLAAKQLFDALLHNGIEPKRCRFGNVFRHTFDKKPTTKPRLKRTIERARRRGHRIVAMGQLASRELTRIGVEHVVIVHPAARGKIRAKAAYAAHIHEKLCGVRS